MLGLDSATTVVESQPTRTTPTAAWLPRRSCPPTAPVYRCATIAAIAVLLAACTHPPHSAAPISSGPQSATTSTARSSTPPPTATQPPPAPHATPAALAAWIQAGTPVDPNAFRTVSLRGTVTTLADPADVAFRLPGPHNDDDVADCATERSVNSILACFAPLKNPPKRPHYPGQWESDWVTFDGASITVGSFHGDPGPFNDGSGKPLNYGDTITFGDYQCRSDPTGMYCMSRSHHSGLAMSSTVTGYGCVKLPKHSEFVGKQFKCD
jgi:hypothetical protein